MPTPTVAFQSCYKMKSVLANFILILGLTTTLHGAEIKVLLNPENPNVSDALVVVFPAIRMNNPEIPVSHSP